MFWGFAFSSVEQACISRAGGIVAKILPEEQLDSVLPRLLCAYRLRLLCYCRGQHSTRNSVSLKVRQRSLTDLKFDDH